MLVSIFLATDNKAGLIENWGKGTLNIIDECIKNGLPKPTFEYEWTAVKTSFYKAQVEAQVELNETEKKIITCLQKRNLSAKELVIELGLKSLSGALKNTIKLRFRSIASHG
jgi:ATP-dependent DNA helicase RecG